MTKDKSKGLALAYIDARDVMDRLDFVVGPLNWQAKYPFLGCCELSLLIGGQWVTKANGAGEPDFEGAKGQYSDAFKRAGVMWGIGRYLYGLSNIWLEIDRYKKFTTTPKLPKWAKPEEWDRIPLETRQDVYAQSLDAMNASDDNGLREIWAEFDVDVQGQLWAMFNSQQRATIKELLR